MKTLNQKLDEYVPYHPAAVKDLQEIRRIVAHHIGEHAVVHEGENVLYLSDLDGKDTASEPYIPGDRR